MVKKTNLMDFLETETSTEGSLSDLIGLLFKSRTDAHITHLLQKRKLLCEHEALETYYTEIVDLIDSFYETAVVHNLVGYIIAPSSMEIPNTSQYFRDLYNKVESYRGLLTSTPFLVSGLDNIQTLISQTLYRLEYIQS